MTKLELHQAAVTLWKKFHDTGIPNRIEVAIIRNTLTEIYEQGRTDMELEIYGLKDKNMKGQSIEDHKIKAENTPS